MARCRYGMSFKYLSSLVVLATLLFSITADALEPPPPPGPGEPKKGHFTYYNPNGPLNLDLPGDSGEKRRLKIYGELWRYQTSLGDSRETQQETVRNWLGKVGAKFIVDSKDLMAVSLQSDDINRRIYLFDISEKETEVTIYLERRLTVDQPISVSIGGKAGDTSSFRIDHDGKRYHSLVVEFEEEDVSLKGGTVSAFGHYERSVHHRHTCRIEHGQRQVVMDTPQYAGVYKWSVYTHAVKPQTVQISLKEGPALPELKDGAKLGALRVRNLPYGSLHLREEWDASLNHPSFQSSKLMADRTPEGDTIFWVPSGYWQVEGTLPEGAGLSFGKAHMIPVHAGHVTLVDWPSSFSKSFAPKGMGRLEILDARHREGLAEVDISLMELDSDIVPQADRIKCSEGGLAGRVLSVEPLKSPLNAVLLLDSSGSMKGSMEQAIKAVQGFVHGLPSDAEISVVDFDTKPKPLQVGNRSELLQALERVRADGATALYDSILLGLDELSGTSRRALIVFTDGVDANWNDTGPGSQATKAEVMEAVEKAGTPLFSIGFGKNPDEDTLTRAADLSGGGYYHASDRKSLEEVLGNIAANLGRHFRVTYERPHAAGRSNVPVMALVVDNSGSMDRSPSREGCDYRIERVRTILKDFSQALPDDFLVQLLTFSDNTRMSQVITADNGAILRGLSLMEGNGGTDIFGSMQAALQTLKGVPSTRRYLVYLTDAAMKVDRDDRGRFDTLLSSLKDEGIQSLFIGVVDQDEGGVFAHAAEKSGGRSVLSTDLDKVKTAFDELALQIVQPIKEEDRIALRLTLSDRDDRGRNRLFSAGRFVDFPKQPEVGQAAPPEAVSWTIGDQLTVYDDVVGKIISGDDLLMRDVRVAKRIPLAVNSSNEAMTLSASEMIFLSRLRGLDPPRRTRFLVIPMKMVNRMKKQKVAVYEDGSRHPAAWMAGSASPKRYEQTIPPYLIPDLTRHLQLRWNQKASLPVSPATWLCREPLLLPGERALVIEPGLPVSGACVFLVPEGEMKQASLHFYDTNYGHIYLPLSGIMPAQPTWPNDLPVRPEKALGSSFALRLTGMLDQPAIGRISAGEGYVFRVVEARLTSKIKAFLSIDPAERFRYHLPTERGELVMRLHPATEYLPLGFHRPTMLAPGVGNTIRLAFRMPEQLAAMKEKGSLLVDVRGGAVRLDLSAAPAQPLELGTPDFSGQGVDIFIQDSGRVEGKVDGARGNFVAVEVTFRDHLDGYHTRIGPLVVLKEKGTAPVDQEALHKRLAEARFAEATKKHRGLGDFGETGVAGPAAAKSTGVSRPSAMGGSLIFGLDEKSLVHDGQTRRGLLLFDLPKEELGMDWEISSLVLEADSLSFQEKPFAQSLLLSERLQVDELVPDRFWDKLEEKVKTLQARRAARGYRRPGSTSARPVSFETADLGKLHVPVPGTIVPGARRLGKMAKEEEVLDLLAELSWVPGRRQPWSQRYSPEAVLTQGWGSASDLAGLAERLLNEQGVVTSRAVVKASSKGRKSLAELIGVSMVRVDSLPALRFEDEEGSAHFLVFPWCRELDQLEGLVQWDGSDREPSDKRQKVQIQVDLELEAIDRKSTGGSRVAADALAGGGEAKTKRIGVLNATFYDDEAGLDVMDIGYTEVREQGQAVLKCILDGPTGRQVGRESVPLGLWRVVGERIEIRMDRQRRTVESPVDPAHPITGRFHALAINLPDIDREAVTELESVRQKAHAAATDPDGLSALKWYCRTVIDRFIAAQTRYEKKLAGELGLKVGRTLNGRCILVTIQRADAEGSVATRIDLLHAANDIHGGIGADIERARRAFSLLTGFADARLEAAAIPDGGMGLFELWAQCPEGTELLFIDRKNKRDFLEMLKAQGFPQAVIDRIEASREALLFPSRPAVIDDKPRWGWLEIDPKTYRTLSRLDNGAAGALLENLIGNLYLEASSYLVGAMVGIDASLWAVSAYSLQLEDFEEIRQKAEEFVLGLSKRFGATVGGDTASVGIGIGSAPGGDYKPDRFIKFSLDFSGLKASNNMLGFGNGYADAAKYYFSQFE